MNSMEFNYLSNDLLKNSTDFEQDVQLNYDLLVPRQKYPEFIDKIE